jgi:hypothetical protein
MRVRTRPLLMACLLLATATPIAASGPAHAQHWDRGRHDNGWHGRGPERGGWNRGGGPGWRGDDRGRRRGPGAGAAIGAGIAGLAVGALLGGALASQAAPPPAVYYPPQPEPPPPPPAYYPQAPYGYGPPLTEPAQAERSGPVQPMIFRRPPSMTVRRLSLIAALTLLATPAWRPPTPRPRPPPRLRPRGLGRAVHTPHDPSPDQLNPISPRCIGNWASPPRRKAHGTPSRR